MVTNGADTMTGITSDRRGPVPPPSFELSNLDAVRWLRDQPSESIDLLITDPAYESLEKHRAVGTTTRLKHSKASSNDWFRIFPNARFGELFAEAYRVLRRNTHFYLLCDAETMFVAKPEAEQAGFKFWKPLVWDKRTIGMGYHYRARYEFILFFEKGKRRLNDLGIPDVLSVPRVHGGYPAEKPVGVSEILIGQSSQPGDTVADPFMGSGSVGVAALKAGRRFLGNDLNPEAVRLSATRLRELGEGTQPADTREDTPSDLIELMRPQPSQPSQTMTGAEYANLIAAYVARRFGARGVKVYREIRVGKSIIGKNRCIDVFCVCEATNKAFAIECKFQDSEGTVDEKIPYSLDDLEAMPMAGCIAYAGKGFSAGVLHMLRASTRAAYCLPVADQGDTTADTKELDHLLAMHFGWWDVFVGKKKPVSATSATTASNGSASTGALDLTDTFLNGPDFPR